MMSSTAMKEEDDDDDPFHPIRIEALLYMHNIVKWIDIKAKVKICDICDRAIS